VQIIATNKKISREKGKKEQISKPKNGINIVVDLSKITSWVEKKPWHIYKIHRLSNMTTISELQ